MVEVQCAELQRRLQGIAPVLRPAVVPKGMEDSLLISRLSPSSPSSCSICGASGNLEARGDWELAFAQHQNRFLGVVHVCAACDSVRSIGRAVSEADGAVVQHFLATNGHKLAGAAGRALYQEAVSLAFSLQVFASNIPDLTPVTREGKPIKEALER